MIARGAQQILENRRVRGLIPAGPVVVSLIGSVDRLDAPLVHAGRGETDWGWVIGLELHVWAMPGVNALRTLLAIHQAAPLGLSLWDIERWRGANVIAYQSAACLMWWTHTGRDEAWWKQYVKTCAGETARDLRLTPWTRDDDREYADHTR